MRTAKITRKTGESTISVDLNIDGDGSYSISTGNGTLNHLLEQLSKHSLFDITINADGDTSAGWHHIVEDVGITLGQALRKSIGDGSGINRMGHAIVPLDEALALVAIDFSGRGYSIIEGGFDEKRIQELPPDLVRHFLESLAAEAKMALHVKTLAGLNDHHKAESIFKALAKALKDAVIIDVRAKNTAPSTKGTISD